MRRCGAGRPVAVRKTIGVAEILQLGYDGSSLQKKNKILSQFKISAEPPLHGEVSKTCKKNIRHDGRQPHIHMHSIQHINAKSHSSTTAAATLLFYYYNHHHHHLLLLLPPQPPNVLLLPPPQPPTTTTLPNSTSTKTYYHCNSTTHLWCRGLGGRQGIGVGRGAPGTGRGWPRRSGRAEDGRGRVERAEAALPWAAGAGRGVGAAGSGRATVSGAVDGGVPV